MLMIIISTPSKLNETIAKCEVDFGGFYKAVVDIKNEIVAIDAQLHADLEQKLISEGSKQEDIWGINIYPDRPRENMIEFYSLINIRPWQNNHGMEVLDDDVKNKIAKLLICY